MKEKVLVCGFCGTKLNIGYFVCQNCAAEYITEEERSKDKVHRKYVIYVYISVAITILSLIGGLDPQVSNIFSIIGVPMYLVQTLLLLCTLSLTLFMFICFRDHRDTGGKTWRKSNSR